MTVFIEFLFILIVSLIPKENQIENQLNYIITDFSQEMKREAFLYTILVFFVGIVAYTFMDQIKKEPEVMIWTKRIPYKN